MRKIVLFILVLLASLSFVFVSCEGEEEVVEPKKPEKATSRYVEGYSGDEFIYKDNKYKTGDIQSNIQLLDDGRTLYVRGNLNYVSCSDKSIYKDGYYLALVVKELEGNSHYEVKFKDQSSLRASYGASNESFFLNDSSSYSSTGTDRYLVYIDPNTKTPDITSFYFQSLSITKRLDISGITFNNQSVDLLRNKITKIKNEEEFKTAVSNGGTYYLGETISISDDITIKKNFNLDLNGKELSLSGLLSLEKDAEDIAVEFKNGRISSSYSTDYAITIKSGAELKLNSVNLTTATSSITIPSGSTGKLTLEKASSVQSSGTYGVYVEGDGSNVIIDSSSISFGSYTDSTALCLIGNGSLSIKGNSSITGSSQALVVRAGEAKIESSTLKVTGNSTTTNDYTNSDWGVGNEVPLATLVVGNRDTNNNSVNVTLTDVTLLKDAKNSNNKRYHTVYVYQKGSDNIVNVTGTLSNASSNNVNSDRGDTSCIYSVTGGIQDKLLTPTLSATYNDVDNTVTITITDNSQNESGVIYTAYYYTSDENKNWTSQSVINPSQDTQILTRIDGNAIYFPKQDYKAKICVYATLDNYISSEAAIIEIGGKNKEKLGTPNLSYTKNYESNEVLINVSRFVDPNPIDRYEVKDSSDGTTLNADETYKVHITKSNTATITLKIKAISRYKDIYEDSDEQEIEIKPQLLPPTLSEPTYSTDSDGKKIATITITPDVNAPTGVTYITSAGSINGNTLTLECGRSIEELSVYAKMEDDSYERSKNSATQKIAATEPMPLKKPSVIATVTEYNGTKTIIELRDKDSNATSFFVGEEGSAISYSPDTSGQFEGKYEITNNPTPRNIIVYAEGDGILYKNSESAIVPIKGKLAALDNSVVQSTSYSESTLILTLSPLNSDDERYIVKVKGTEITPEEDGTYKIKQTSEVQNVSISLHKNGNYIDSEPNTSVSCRGKLNVPTYSPSVLDDGRLLLTIGDVSPNTLVFGLYDKNDSAITSGYTHSNNQYYIDRGNEYQKVKLQITTTLQNFDGSDEVEIIVKGVLNTPSFTSSIENGVLVIEKVDISQDACSGYVVKLGSNVLSSESIPYFDNGSVVYKEVYKVPLTNEKREVTVTANVKQNMREYYENSKEQKIVIPSILDTPNFTYSYDGGGNFVLTKVDVSNASSYEVMVDGTTTVTDTLGVYTIAQTSNRQSVSIVAKGDGANYADSYPLTLTIRPSSDSGTILEISQKDNGSSVTFTITKNEDDATYTFTSNGVEVSPDAENENTYTITRDGNKKDIVITSTSVQNPTANETWSFVVSGILPSPSFTSDENSALDTITITPDEKENATYVVKVDGVSQTKYASGNYVVTRSNSIKLVEIQANPTTGNEKNYISSEIQRIVIRGKLEKPQFTATSDDDNFYISEVSVSNATSYIVKLNGINLTKESEGVNAGKYVVARTSEDQKVYVTANSDMYVKSDSQEITISAKTV